MVNEYEKEVAPEDIHSEVLGIEYHCIKENDEYYLVFKYKGERKILYYCPPGTAMKKGFVELDMETIIKKKIAEIDFEEAVERYL